MVERVYNQAEGVRLVRHSDEIIIRPIRPEEIGRTSFMGQLVIENDRPVAKFATYPEDNDEDEDREDYAQNYDDRVLINQEYMGRGIPGDFVVTGFGDAPALLMTRENKQRLDGLNVLGVHPESTEEKPRFTFTEDGLVAIRALEQTTFINGDRRIDASAGQYVYMSENGMKILWDKSRYHRATADNTALVPLSLSDTEAARRLMKLAVDRPELRDDIAPHVREIMAVRNSLAANAETPLAISALRELDASLRTDPNRSDILSNEQFAAISRVIGNGRRYTDEPFPRPATVEAFLTRRINEINQARREQYNQTQAANPNLPVEQPKYLPNPPRFLALGTHPDLKNEAVRVAFREVFAQRTQVPMEAIQVTNYRSAQDAGYTQLVDMLRTQGRQISAGGPVTFRTMPGYQSRCNGVYEFQNVEFMLIEEARGIAVYAWPSPQALEAALNHDRRLALAGPAGGEFAQVGAENNLLAELIGEDQNLAQANPDIMVTPLVNEESLNRASAMLAIPVGPMLANDINAGHQVLAIADRKNGIIRSVYVSDGLRIISHFGPNGDTPSFADQQIAAANLNAEPPRAALAGPRP
jgi:hypothetical protein